MLPVKVKLNRAKEITKELYLYGNRQPVIWIGAPGIGKSEAVKQLAMELANEAGKEFVELKFKMEKGATDYRVVFNTALKILEDPDRYFVFNDMRLTEYEPVDLQGVPRDFDFGNRKLFDYVPFIWQLVVSACAGITFLDELTHVQRPDVRSLEYKILKDFMFGRIQIHEDHFLIGAGNSPEHAATAGLLDSSVVNRVKIFEIEPPTIDEWAVYMNKFVGDWDRRVYSFLNKFPQFFFEKPPDVETLTPFSTPRQWTELAKVSHLFDDDTVEILAYSMVSSEAASHFITFIRTNVPDVEEILKDPSAFAMLDIDAKYLAAALVAGEIHKEFSNSKNPADKPNLNKFVRVLTWLLNNDRELLQLIAVMSGNKAMRKLHTMCMMNTTTRPIANFFAESIKTLWEAGV